MHLAMVGFAESIRMAKFESTRASASKMRIRFRGARPMLLPCCSLFANVLNWASQIIFVGCQEAYNYLFAETMLICRCGSFLYTVLAWIEFSSSGITTLLMQSINLLDILYLCIQQADLLNSCIKDGHLSSWIDFHTVHAQIFFKSRDEWYMWHPLFCRTTS